MLKVKPSLCAICQVGLGRDFLPASIDIAGISFCFVPLVVLVQKTTCQCKAI
jgi:hypothetical protein